MWHLLMEFLFGGLFGPDVSNAFLNFLIPAAVGAISGLAGGGGGTPKWYQKEQQYWDKFRRDQANQGAQNYAGSRGRAEQGFEDIYNNPDLTPEERARMSDLTPDELAKMGLTPEQLASMQYSPEEQARMMVSPEEEAGIMAQTLDPISGAAQRATDALNRASSSRGAAGSYGANINRVFQDQASQAADAAQKARLGITAERRAATGEIVGQRARANQFGATFGQEGARFGADYRQRGTQFGAGFRQRNKEFGATGRFNLAGQDLSQIQGATPNFGEPTQGVPWWQRTLGGAAQGAMYGYEHRND